MNLSEYLNRRAALGQAPERRPTCANCRKSMNTCYCSTIRPFTSPVSFVILQHSAEALNTIATARMAHLSIKNSTLIVDRDFSGNSIVNGLLADTSYRHLMLYPSAAAIPIEQAFAEEKEIDGRPLLLWVLDAKWSQVPKMLRLSPNIRQIPMTKFTPDRASQFQVRRQPTAFCLSTVEAIHWVIDRYAEHHALDFTAHHSLLDVFQYLVKQQLGFVGGLGGMRHNAAKEKRAARRRLP